MRRSHIRGDEYRDEGISFSHLTPDCYMLENYPKKSHFQSWENSKNFLTLVILIIAIGSYLWIAFSAEINLLTPAGLKAVIQDQGAFSAFVYIGTLDLTK